MWSVVLVCAWGVGGVWGAWGALGAGKWCYWQAQCPYQSFGTRTPYDSVRGDIRDLPLLEGCEAVSLWALVRHGNRNPGDGGTRDMRELQSRIKDEILEKFDYEMGTSQLCSQDIQNLREWKWNSTMDNSPSYLTGIGYEEVFQLATRVREKYPQLLLGSPDQFYFRPTVKQRTITSAMAFVHGLSEGTNLTLSIDQPIDGDELLRPYDNCERYQDEVKHGALLEEQLDHFYKTPEFLAVQQEVQSRLGIPTNLTASDIYNLYELCRFERTWSAALRSPWCAPFTDHHLQVLEYRDDVRHYYKNGYGSEMNAKLGYPVLADLYRTMEAAERGSGRLVTGYFAHDSLIDMVYAALGLYRDPAALTATNPDPQRLWRTTYIAPFTNNIMVILNRCSNGPDVSHKVQVLHNERPTSLCPEGCSWEEFQAQFSVFTNYSMEFCNSTYSTPGPSPDEAPGAANAARLFTRLLALVLFISILQ